MLIILDLEISELFDEVLAVLEVGSWLPTVKLLIVALPFDQVPDSGTLLLHVKQFLNGVLLSDRDLSD